MIKKLNKLSDIRDQWRKQEGQQMRRRLPTETKQIIALTEEEINAFAYEQRAALMHRIADLVAQEEASNESGNVARLFQVLEVVCRNLPVLGGYEDIRRQHWEMNHAKIINEIHNYVLKHNTIPPVNVIANLTKLSRQTVHCHLREGIAGKYYAEHLKTFEYLSVSLLNKLYELGITGNVAAAKVYLEHVMKATQPAPIRQQNNYVQVNNTRIDEIIINELPDDAKRAIESIINTYTVKTA